MHKKINNNFDGISTTPALLSALIKRLSLQRSFDVSDGCLYDGFVLKAGETITIQGTTTELICLGHNLYKELIH